MLIVGELDNNVPAESTLRLADALIKAGKDFDLVVVPGAGHGMGGEYGTRRMHDFFVRHLLGTEPPDRNVPRETRVARQTSGANDSPLDLSAIASIGPISKIADRFRSDEASLRRYYVVEQSPTTHARFRKFYADWLAAVLTLPESTIADGNRSAYDELKNDILESFARVERNTQRGAKAAHLLPFAPAILELAEERRQVKKVDSQKSAAVVDKLGLEIKALCSSLEARLKSRAADDAELSADNLKMAAETVRELRSNLRGWFRFYDGYDPMFSWWVRAPYQKTDAELEKYAALLIEPPAAEATAATQASFQAQDNDAAKSQALPTSANPAEVDVPDLSALIAEPPTQMEAIIAKFRSDFPGFGGWGGGRGGRRGGGRESAGGDLRDAGDDQGVRRLAARDRYEDDDDDEEQLADRDDSGRERTARSGDRRRGQQNTPEARERQKRRLTEWATALDGLNFDSFSQADRVDYLMLKNHIQYRLKRLEIASDIGR